MRKLIFPLLLLSIFLFVVVPVFAKEGINRTVLPKTETIDRDYFAGNEEVQLSGTVNGDAYVGGGSVIVDGTIDGDLLVGGGSVTISGSVQGDIRVGGGTVTISGANILGNVTAGGGQITIDKSTVIQGSLVAGGGDLKVLAPIGKGATIGGGNVLISNFVGGDVLAGSGKLTLSPEASINGDLTYWSEEKANISEGASVSGSIKQEVPPKDARKAKETGEDVAKAIGGLFFFLKVIDILTALIIGLIMLALFPVYMNNAATIVRTRFWQTLLWGLLVLVGTPIVAVIFMITLLGIPLGITLLILYFIVLWFAKIYVIYALGQVVVARTKNKAGAYVTFIVGALALIILQIIPIVNVFVSIAVLLSGLGASLLVKREYYTRLRKSKQI